MPADLDLSPLYRLREKDAFIKAARVIEKRIIKENAQPFLAYRLALLIAYRGFRTSRLVSYLINCNNPRLLYRVALDVRGADLIKIQKALLIANEPLLIAKFGCFVPSADKKTIEQAVIISNNAKAAYFLLRYNKNFSVKKLKPILLKSKRPRYLYALAQALASTHTHARELEHIQTLLLASSSPTYLRLFAQNIKNADILKLENRVIQLGITSEIIKFVEALKTPRSIKLSILC